MQKLIIFDCDGVLVDSEIVAHKAGIKILSDFGYVLTLEESIRKFTGKSVRTIHQLIMQDSGIDMPMDEVQSKVLASIGKELNALMLPVLEHEILKSYNICVASSSERNRILAALAISKQAEFFKHEHIFSAAQVKQGKPAPDLFLFAAEQMGYEPQDCLVIEDSLAGIQAAKAANMPVIAFLGGGHTDFAWYKAMIAEQNIPMAHNAMELIPELTKFIGLQWAVN